MESVANAFLEAFVLLVVVVAFIAGLWMVVAEKREPKRIWWEAPDEPLRPWDDETPAP